MNYLIIIDNDFYVDPDRQTIAVYPSREAAAQAMAGEKRNYEIVKSDSNEVRQLIPDSTEGLRRASKLLFEDLNRPYEDLAAEWEQDEK
jgi:hypothetical protein